MDQFVQVAGSLFVLTAFVAVQRGRWSPSSRRYLLLNTVGSAVLAVDAVAGAQWGFLLLEATWAAVSGAGLLRSYRTGRNPVESVR